VTQEGSTNPVLARLEALVGDWRVEGSMGGQDMPAVRSSCGWIEDGWFLRQHTALDPDDPRPVPPEFLASSPLPVTSVIGLDDTSARFIMLYADARGVHRVYQMTLEDSEWTVWRDAPGFNQRFRARFDGPAVIRGAWEVSDNGLHWRHDFDLTYTRVTS
jgi:hypothetical protein